MKKMIALFFTTACVFSAVGCGWKMQTKAKEEERKALNYGTAKWNFRQGPQRRLDSRYLMTDI